LLPHWCAQRNSWISMRRSLASSVSLVLHEAIVCPRRISPCNQLCVFVFNETEIRRRWHGGRSATVLRQRLSIRKRERQCSNFSLCVSSPVSRLINAACRFASPRTWLDTELHHADVPARQRSLTLTAVTTVGGRKFLVGMLDENHRGNAQGGLAGDHQPSCRSSRSPSGGSSGHAFVRRDYSA
jgi:hypothetical protein